MFMFAVLMTHPVISYLLTHCGEKNNNIIIVKYTLGT